MGLFLMVFLVGTSCKTYQKVDWIKPNLAVEERSKYFEPRQLSRISEGDDLFVLTKDSVSYDITYSEVRNDSIQGLFTQKNNKRLRVPIETGVPISEINMIKVKKLNKGATLLTVISVPLVLWLWSKTITFDVGFSGI
ncbi:hypothetical protein JYB62_05890 [Algoriphagus lutimaris]|uniref:hypothetical protein n=1 Tax=Algoriphagus lutimaris TaxID=613197 RepID=UPI00196B4B4A|nr:hypothetical protein [Algoriphagus lutimaris]MBN3519529.1 hypothetical protein [Algoriphagus lutimaris]